MSTSALLKSIFLLCLLMALFSAETYAEINNRDLLDNVLERYQSARDTWQTIIRKRASWLFWMLALISMVWTFGMMALRRADIGEFFAELIRFTFFTGFFWWLLDQGPTFADWIIKSLRTVGSQATVTREISLSNIVDIGFKIFYSVIGQTKNWQQVDTLVGALMAVGILVILALIGINILLLLVSGWILAYAGIFLLGFGGSRWTSDIAIHYYKTVLGLAIQWLVMTLLLGIAYETLDSYHKKLSPGLVQLTELGVMLVVSVALLCLINKIPPMIAGIVTGAHIGATGNATSYFSGGPVTIPSSPVGTAASAMTMSSAAIASGLGEAVSDTKALINAFRTNASNMLAASSSTPSTDSGSTADVADRDGNRHNDNHNGLLAGAMGDNSPLARKLYTPMATRDRSMSSSMDDTSTQARSEPTIANSAPRQAPFHPAQQNDASLQIARAVQSPESSTVVPNRNDTMTFTQPYADQAADSLRTSAISARLFPLSSTVNADVQQANWGTNQTADEDKTIDAEQEIAAFRDGNSRRSMPVTHHDPIADMNRSESRGEYKDKLS